MKLPHLYQKEAAQVLSQWIWQAASRIAIDGNRLPGEILNHSITDHDIYLLRTQLWKWIAEHVRFYDEKRVEADESVTRIRVYRVYEDPSTPWKYGERKVSMVDIGRATGFSHGAISVALTKERQRRNKNDT